MTERAERLLVDALTACGADATPRELRLVAAALESTSEQDLAAELAVASQVEGGAAQADASTSSTGAARQAARSRCSTCLSSSARP